MYERPKGWAKTTGRKEVVIFCEIQGLEDPLIVESWGRGDQGPLILGEGAAKLGMG